MKSPQTLPIWVINLFFLIGLLSAIAFRVLIVVQHLRPELFRLVWYGGIIGYVIFFSYRYFISSKRRNAIAHYGLIEKLRENVCLTDGDRDVVVYLLSSIAKSRENLNYLIIFVLSLLAVIADQLFVFFGR